MYYLIIRPISEDPAEVEPYLDSLMCITSIDKHTLKQKFQGDALNLLKHHKEREVLDDIASELSEEGIKAVVVAKEELRRPQRALRAASLEIGSSSIELFSKDNESLLDIDKKLKCLIVISCKDFKKVLTKKVARHVMRFAKPMTLDEKLQAFFVNQPVMEIYSNGSKSPVRIDSTRFNYTSLGDKNKLSASLNFKTILEMISKHAGQVILETGFGENSLPFLNALHESDGDRAFNDFAVYSLFIRLANDRGIFAGVENLGINGLIPVPILDDLTSIFWAGPSMAGSKKKKESPGTIDETKKDDNPDSLPMPPSEFTQKRSTSRLKRIFKFKSSGFTGFSHGLGPKIIFYPLNVIMFVSFALIYVTESGEPLAISLMSIGLMVFARSFVLIKRKRLIENSPRSKIRSMPMGEVEVSGKAVQKYYLQSPYTYTKCVYYSYKIYELENTQDGKRWRLKDWGNSGRIPFYLKDDTGTTLILPKDAILHAGVTETLQGDMLSSIFGSGSSKTDRKIVETSVAAGQFLYVLGHAHRARNSHVDKKKEMTKRLLDLKLDKTRLKKYDTDGDGKISGEEWDAARDDVEHQILAEQLSKDTARDEVAIGAPPYGGVFIISDKKEAHMIRSMAWKIPLYLVAGSATALAGLFFMLKIIKNNDILSILQSIFSSIHIN